MAVVKKVRGAPSLRETAKENRKKKRVGREEPDQERFRLPTERSEPADDLGAYTWLIFGEKKIGKTTLTALFGKAVHLFTEPGGKALRVYPVVIDDWRKFRKAVRALKKDTKFDTVVVDIVDKLYPMCEDFTCERLGIQDLAEEDWGKGWRENRKEFQRVLDELLNTGKGVVFISHAQEQEVETRDGKTYDRMMPTMHKRMRDEIESVVDICCRFWEMITCQQDTDSKVASRRRMVERFEVSTWGRLRSRPTRTSSMPSTTNMNRRRSATSTHQKRRMKIERRRRRSSSSRSATTANLRSAQ
jgi:hypothetical protein